MNLNRIIPTLLIKDSALVKTVKFKNPKYIGDPINAVKIFNLKEVDELVLLDIGVKKKINFELISEIVSEAFMPVAYGGGIHTLEDIGRLFDIGIDKVIINSAAFLNKKLIAEACSIYGSQSIVLSVDLKKNLYGKQRVHINNGKKRLAGDYTEIIKNTVDLGFGEIIVNSIDRDGTMIGYDLESIKRISKKIDIPLICLGGAGSKEDLIKGLKNGASAVACGSLFIFNGIHKAVLISYIKIDELNING